MRIIARSTLARFWELHPETRASLERWHAIVRASDWKRGSDVIDAFPKAKNIDSERVRFEVAGGNFRMVVAFDFERQIAFIKFLGTHAEYDAIDVRSIGGRGTRK